MTQLSERLQSGAPARAEAAAPQPGRRLGWLDALRGVAALGVVFQHAGPTWLWPQYNVVHQKIDLGIFGVFLFFLVSGYIVPASLERRGDVRAFWVGRIFRLLPLFVVVVAVARLLPERYAAVGAGVYPGFWPTGAANLLMLPDLLGLNGALRVAWTLSYEMVFYFLVTALFVFGRHRLSGPIAVGFAAVAVFAGAALPLGMLSAGADATGRLVAVVAAIVVVALTCILRGNRTVIRIGAVLLAGLALTLIFLNSRSAGFETMMILATMFAGTAIYRAEQGQIGRLQAVACCGLVLVGGLVAGTQQGPQYLNRIWSASAASWCTAFGAAWMLFLVAWLLRRYSVPRFLSWLGTISYAVYLIHVPLLNWIDWLFADLHFQPHGRLQAGLCFCGFVAALCGVSYLAHRLVELPAQKLGRRLLRGPATVAG
ncbi:peptidoglycan/LPS O-acetylase OafA/YrhL [Streptacidiphilus sp. MAP12-16]|uniref:acyltransferase family protein n=1 Tax=Streptacidiphilus sp. MAP12-16 TaxID=3156300 RepID=UPI003512AFA7